MKMPFMCEGKRKQLISSQEKFVLVSENYMLLCGKVMLP